MRREKLKAVVKDYRLDINLNHPMVGEEIIRPQNILDFEKRLYVIKK